MKSPYYEDYHAMANKNKISIKFTPDERALLETEMFKEDWTNTSSFIKYRLFGYNKTEMKKNSLFKNKDKIGIILFLNNYLKNFIDYTRFAITAFKKELARFSSTENAADNLADASINKKRINTIAKWVHAVDKKMNVILLLVTKISEHLALDTSLFIKSFLGVAPFNQNSSKKEYPLGKRSILATGRVLDAPTIVRFPEKPSEEFTRVLIATGNDFGVDTYEDRFVCLIPKISIEIHNGDSLMVRGSLVLMHDKNNNELRLPLIYCSVAEIIKD